MTGTAWLDEIGPARRADHAHQHPQRRRGARCGHRLAGARRRHRCRRLLVVAAGRGRDLGRRPERHQRLSRAPRARLAGARRGRRRPGRRRQRRRRHRHDLPRVQVRHRHLVAASRRRPTTRTRWARWCRRITARASRCASRACRSGRTSRSAPRAISRRPQGRFWLDHRRARDRRPAAAHPAEARRKARGARPRPHGQLRRQRLGRHLHRLLDRQRRRAHRASHWSSRSRSATTTSIPCSSRPCRRPRKPS